MRLTKQTHYAIGILRLCAEAGDQLVKAADVAHALDMTLQNTLKSVHILTKAGFLAPIRGRNGGLKLARPARDIRISDVVQVIEFAGETVAGEEPRSGSGPILDNAFAAFIAVLDQHTIADIAKPASAKAARPSKTAKPTRVKVRAKTSGRIAAR
jgi:Rrf2 family nitric oxide-sensitive transcriptional repressor